MIITDFYLAIVIGLVVGLIFSELTGISTGGIIVPCYMGLVIDTPEVILSIFFVSLLTYLIVEYILPKYMILFGRRRFVAILIVGVVLKLILEVLFPIMPFPIFLFRGIGIMIPGLLCNAYMKQGIKLTVFSSLLVSAIVFGSIAMIHTI